MSRAAWLVLASVGLLAVGATALSLRAQEAKPDAAPKSPFSAKYLVVLSKNGAGAATLEHPQLQTLGGRSFVVGREAKNSPFTKEQFRGATLWLPVDEIAQLIEADDLRPRE